MLLHHPLGWTPTSPAGGPPARRYAGPGGAVIEFIETFCRHSKGEWAGRPYRLAPWQVALVRDIFDVEPSGRRRFRTAYIGLPRKNGKSTLGAALALYGLVADDEPGAEVYSCAGDRAQAEIVFAEAKRMVQADPDLSARILDRRYYLEDPVTQSVYRVLSAEAPRQLGRNPHFVVFDEVHVQPSFDLWVAMTQGSGTRRQPLTVGITTAGFGVDSPVARYLYEYGKKVESGEVRDRSFLFRWREPADPACDWLDEDVWRACNPALSGRGKFLKIEELRKEARSTPEAEFRRFHLNQWTVTRHAWLPQGAWQACVDPARVVDPKEPVALGFDGSWTRDSTALVGCTVTRPHLFVLGCWERPLDEPMWQVPFGEVDALVHDAFARLNVLELACDPHMWRNQIQGWRDEGLPVSDWPFNSIARQVPAVRDFYGAVLDKHLTHDGDPRLARHVANATVKSDRYGVRIVKDKAEAKIDLASAAVIAYDRALDLGRSAVSVYETRGMVML